MSKYIHIDVEAKIPTIASCVKLTSGNTYEDTITKNLEYFGDSQRTISFTNSCSVPFTIPDFVLFSDTYNGGNFEARISGFTIGANQVLNVPLKYYGINKSDSTPKSYSIAYNGSSIIYKLNITTPKVNTPPTISDISIVLENRQGKVFSLDDFIPHYFDADGDNLDAVILTGDVSVFRLNGNPVVSGEEIPANLIASGKLEYLAQNTNDEFSVSVLLKVKDSEGSISL